MAGTEAVTAGMTTGATTAIGTGIATAGAGAAPEQTQPALAPSTRGHPPWSSGRKAWSPGTVRISFR